MYNLLPDDPASITHPYSYTDVGRLPDGYCKAVPLPRVSRHRQSASPVTVIDIASSTLIAMNHDR